MRATIYLRREELKNYVEKKGYTIETIRRIILREFGFKNSKQFLSVYKNLSPSTLNIKLAYMNRKEYDHILVLISDILKFLKSEIDSAQPMQYFLEHGTDILYYSLKSSSLKYNNKSTVTTLYNYTVSSVFRKEFISELTEKTEINEIYMSI